MSLVLVHMDREGASERDSNLRIKSEGAVGKIQLKKNKQNSQPRNPLHEGRRGSKHLLFPEHLARVCYSPQAIG